MPKYTQGPWKAKGGLVFADPPGSPGVCVASCGDDGLPSQLANAKLIAAAPEMHRALLITQHFLKDLMNSRYDHNPSDKLMFQVVEAVLRKVDDKD